MTKFSSLNKKGTSSSNPNREKTKSGQRTKSTIMRLKMYKSGSPIRNKDGKIVGGNLLMKNKSGGQIASEVARIAPNRRYFGNTRTIAQKELDNFREEMILKNADPHSIILKKNKIPTTLLNDNKVNKLKILGKESFRGILVNSKLRKRTNNFESCPTTFENLKQSADEKNNKYMNKNMNISENNDDILNHKDEIFSKGQSKRIWGELYKVIDCSDVILQILDSRNIPGTRSIHIENHLRKNSPHKHLVLVLNKCDLVPTWATKKWVKLLSKEYPTIAFHGSLTNAFGKGALINLLRQYAKLNSDKRQISVVMHSIAYRISYYISYNIS
jgi:nuclear GTP-binding protein